MNNAQFIKETHSTNDLLREMLRKENLPEGFVVYTDFQTAGKGQVGNSWESEKAKNLMFSTVFYPNQLPMDQLFLISQLVSVAIKNVLDKYVDGISVKWPNDIYWNDKKIAGILIENSLQGNKVKSVVGIGLNVNQRVFRSPAPNPVSLHQIIGKSLNRKRLLQQIIETIQELYSGLNAKQIRSDYEQMLYRKSGFYTYKAAEETFRAKIVRVHPDGQLELETEAGERKYFYFKEVEFV